MTLETKPEDVFVDLDEQTALMDEQDKEQACQAAALRADMELGQIAVEKGEYDRVNRILVDTYEDGLKAKKTYEKLLGSRAIKIWMKCRAVFGKPYVPYQASLPRRPSNATPALSSERIGFLRYLNQEKDEIGDSNGSAYYRKSKIRIGIMSDEFSAKYLEDAVELIYVSPDNYRDVLRSGNIDCLLFVTLWRGLGQYVDVEASVRESFHYYGEHGLKIALGIIKYARERGITFVFQSIEDPPSYHRYLEIAKCADVIFTSAAEKIPDYIRDTGNERVYAETFGINPLIHNPIGLFRKRQRDDRRLSRCAMFAGTWYKKYKERCKASRVLFDGVLGYNKENLYFFNRHWGDLECLVPDPYRASMLPSLDWEILQKAHKMFDWTLNLNTVTDSPTMCAMRVYEVQALGGLLISNYALSVSNRFPGVFFALDAGEVPRILSGYTDDELAGFQIEGVRDLYSGSTVYDRLNRIFSLAGIEERFEGRPVYVVCEGPRAREALEGQSLRGAVAVDPAEAASLSGGLAIWWDGEASGPDHLLDMVNAFKFAAVDYVRYEPWGDWARCYEFVEGDAEARGVMFDLDRVPAARVLSGDLSGLRGFGVAAPRWGRDTSGVPKDLAVIVPVYNNGEYLWKRGFRSLMRSSVFDRMRIYLVDDGSTDGVTPDVVRRIARDFDNVEAYLFGDGGSGSASRPRNKGFEMSSEPYVTYLDPDNEAVGDGYARLLEIAGRTGVDVAFGTVPFVKGAEGYVGDLRFGEEGLIGDPRAALVRRAFCAQSMQAGVVRRSLLEDADISFVEGAVSEDTLFFYEVMAAASSAYSMGSPVHVYYADRDGSTVNSVGVRFFERTLAGERATADFLRRAGLLGDFQRVRLDSYMDGWIREKLADVPLDSLPECAELARLIREAYENEGQEAR